MNIYKIAGLLGIVIAVVAAFITLPYAGVALALLGVIVGWGIATEDSVRVIVSALALAALAGTFGGIPVAGPSLTMIIANIGTMVAGAALLIILRNMIRRIKG